MFSLSSLFNIFRPAVKFPPKEETSINPLEGKALRYYIGLSLPPITKQPNIVTEVGYDTSSKPESFSIAYCNLFDEHNTGKYGPYLNTSDTAVEYNEGQIDPSGPGWHKNLKEQFNRRKLQGFKYVELDNPDAYDWIDVKRAIDLAQSMGLMVISKNPQLLDEAKEFIGHPNVYGCIVERNAGDATTMNKLRAEAGKPDLPVWFVSFGSGRQWSNKQAETIKTHQFVNMGVTHSSRGEYQSSEDLFVPNNFKED